jgi:hypothetical protein
MADNLGKARLGWRYWPTVYFWTAVNTLRTLWRQFLAADVPPCDCSVCAEWRARKFALLQQKRAARKSTER